MQPVTGVAYIKFDNNNNNDNKLIYIATAIPRTAQTVGTVIQTSAIGLLLNTLLPLWKIGRHEIGLLFACC